VMSSMVLILRMKNSLAGLV
jgi:hypothetical protein